jgi:hypothetical protein
VNTTRITLALLAISLLAAGCSASEDEPTVSPSSAFPTGSGTASGSGATGSSGASGGGQASPDAATGRLSSGSVTIVLTGDLPVDRTLEQLITTVYEPPPGALVLVWTAGGSNATTLGIGGASFTGSRPTSTSLTFNLVVQSSGGVATFQSMDGECRITIDEATRGRVAGSYRCPALSSTTGEVVDAQGSFEAEA